MHHTALSDPSNTEFSLNRQVHHTALSDAACAALADLIGGAPSLRELHVSDCEPGFSLDGPNGAVERRRATPTNCKRPTVSQTFGGEPNQTTADTGGAAESEPTGSVGLTSALRTESLWADMFRLS